MIDIPWNTTENKSIDNETKEESTDNNRVICYS